MTPIILEKPPKKILMYSRNNSTIRWYLTSLLQRLFGIIETMFFETKNVHMKNNTTNFITIWNHAQISWMLSNWPIFKCKLISLCTKLLDFYFISKLSLQSSHIFLNERHCVKAIPFRLLMSGIWRLEKILLYVLHNILSYPF